MTTATPLQCSATATATEVIRTAVLALPGGVNLDDPEGALAEPWQCDLSTGHDGQHVAYLGTGEDDEHDEHAHWMRWRSHGGAPMLLVGQCCDTDPFEPDEDDDGPICHLVTGHSGAHMGYPLVGVSASRFY